MGETKAQRAQAERDQAREALRETFPVGSEVSTIVLHVSQSGMSRAIAVLAHGEGTSVRNVSHLVARATESNLHRRYRGVERHGAGMDMAYDLVDSLGHALYGDGYALRHRGI